MIRQHDGVTRKPGCADWIFLASWQVDMSVKIHSLWQHNRENNILLLEQDQIWSWKEYDIIFLSCVIIYDKIRQYIRFFPSWYFPTHTCHPFEQPLTLNPDSLTINQYLTLNPLNYSFKQQPHVNVNKKHQKRWRKKVSCLKNKEKIKEEKVKEKGGSPIKTILQSKSRSHREISVLHGQVYNYIVCNLSIKRQLQKSYSPAED